MTRQRNATAALAILVCAFAAVCAVSLVGCQPPPVEVNVDPDVHIELPPRHHPLRPWLDEPRKLWLPTTENRMKKMLLLLLLCLSGCEVQEECPDGVCPPRQTAVDVRWPGGGVHVHREVNR